MKLIPLSQFYNCKNKSLNLFAQVDDEDYDFLMQWRWIATRDKGGSYYAIASKGKHQIKMHRLIMQVFERKITVDHIITEQTLNNQKSNLRLATPIQQAWNRRKQKQGKSKYKGVCISKERKDRKTTNCSNEYYISYRLNMRINGVKVRKSFKAEIDAAKAYDELAKKHFGEFAKLNFPDDLSMNC